MRSGSIRVYNCIFLQERAFTLAPGTPNTQTTQPTTRIPGPGRRGTHTSPPGGGASKSFESVQLIQMIEAFEVPQACGVLQVLGMLQAFEVLRVLRAFETLQILQT